MVLSRGLMNWIPLLIIACVLVGIFVLKRASFVSTEKALELLSRGAMVVDVRNPGEYSSGHVPGALNIPLGDLRNDLPRRIPDKGKVLLLHCLSGARSGLARRQVTGMGYTAFNLGSYGRANSIVQRASRQSPSR
jgi:phage shock protein E